MTFYLVIRQNGSSISYSALYTKYTSTVSEESNRNLDSDSDQASEF